MLCNIYKLLLFHIYLPVPKKTRFTEPKTYQTPPIPFGSNYNNYPLLKEIIAVMKMNSNQIFKPYSMFNDGLSCLFNEISGHKNKMV